MADRPTTPQAPTITIYLHERGTFSIHHSLPVEGAALGRSARFADQLAWDEMLGALADLTLNRTTMRGPWARYSSDADEALARLERRNARIRRDAGETS
jgi:hypothetical protein